ncbi:unnamed protein product [Lathyrus oleraceus]|uniref:DRBM domain-containing protein n=1 Tax=Pisum sativum TaxID=3888 RepID=A0A9D4WN39_PEA|nr:double-stranded RNA-binding protein 1-like [Pisum sativum]KAI5404508.1 hypothetical protein KIW84_051607 [Pisum sativum]
MSTATEDFQGVSNCYVFKSRLQEYAQKAGLPTPVYETIKDGPSHEPCFRSTVIVNDVRYDSLPGFFNRKAAEQSAAEVALMELAKSGEVNQSITQPVHETGLCKNLLQEYAQKMNYAMPTYQCKKDDTPPGRVPLFSCTVDIGGILYIGGTTKTKKEAEIKAARTALLAIQTNASQASENQFGHLTVIPSRKRAADSVADEASKAPKPKKARFKRKFPKRKQSRDKKPHVQTVNAGDGANVNHGIESLANAGDGANVNHGIESLTNAGDGANVNHGIESLTNANDESGIQEIKSEAMFPSEAVKNSENGVPSEAVKNSENGVPSEAVKNSENGVSTNHHEKETTIHHEKETTIHHEKAALAGDGSFALNKQEVFDNGKLTEFQSEEVKLGNVVTEVSFAPNGDLPANGDIPAKSNGMFAPTGDTAKSDGMFAPTRDIPAKSDGMFVPNGDDIPAKSDEMNKHFNGDMVSSN